MAQQLQILVARVEDPDSMASGSLPSLPPVPGALMLSSDLCRQQACTWHIHLWVKNSHTHTHT